jgi:endoglucanase
MPVKFTGVNFAGAEFTPKELLNATKYYYPTNGELDYFLTRGFKTFRIPVRMERIGRKDGETYSFHSPDINELDRIVKHITDAGGNVVIDPHNYATFHGAKIGTSGFSFAFFKDFWTRVADRYKANERVIFGLMNEPHDLAGGVWRNGGGQAVAGIRSTGATNLVLIPGDNWTSAYNYVSTGNAAEWRDLLKSDINAAVEVHTYFDNGHEGNETGAISGTIGRDRNTAITAWAKQNGIRLWTGEFGAADNPTALAALVDFLTFMDDNSDVWLGWSYWDAQRWNQGYMFNCYSSSSSEKPQLDILEAHATDGIDDEPSPPVEPPDEPPPGTDPNEEPVDEPDEPPSDDEPEPPQVVESIEAIGIVEQPLIRQRLSDGTVRWIEKP